MESNTYPKIKVISGRCFVEKINIHDPNFDRPISELEKEYPDLENRIIINLE